MERLWVVYSTLEGDLPDAEHAVATGEDRRFDVAAYRVALKTLGIELALLDLERPAS